MRKHVTPAHPRATILDPARGRSLPPAGAEVTWSAYWARLEAREDITVADVAEPAAPSTVAPTPEAAAPEPAHG